MNYLTDKQYLKWKRRRAWQRLGHAFFDAMALIIVLMAGWYVLLIVLIDAMPR